MSNGKGIPLLSDRSAWDSINYPEKHSKDLYDETPIIHLPSALNEGDIPIWDGEKWITIPSVDQVIVSVSDTASVDLEIIDQTITATVIPEGIKLDDLGTPDDNTDLNASSSYHGLLPKLNGVVTDYLNGAGQWSTPAGGGGGGGSSQIEQCILRTSTPQTISSGSDVPLTYETSEELLDLSGMHDEVNKSRVNILEDGIYELHGQAEYSGGSGSTRYVYFGKTTGGVRSEIGDSFSSNVSAYGSAVFCVLNLVAGDFVELLAYHTSGSGVTVSRSSFLVRKISQGAGYTEGARVYNSSSQSLPTETDVAINFDQEEYDTNSIHDNSTNNTRLTCKTKGKYQISGMISFANNSTGYRLAYIRMTKGSNVSNPALLNVPAINGDATFVNINTVLSMEVDDYIELVGRHTKGTACDVGDSYLAMQRIG